jgi:endoglucanase
MGGATSPALPVKTGKPVSRSTAAAIPPDSSGISSLNSHKFSLRLGRGWNLGNSLEATGGETAWHNPKTTQRLIDSVKAAGFSSIRIPVAWSKFSDKTTCTIDERWMNRVEEVVNYALNAGMYVVLNEHWEGGWLQPTAAAQREASRRLKAIWRQVAIRFRDYDDHLIFAGTNEVMVEGEYGEPTPENRAVQNHYNQLFVDTVRATGGRNAFRYLVVQGYNTNVDHTLNHFVMPRDSAKRKLMVEVHYYDPYNFTINEKTRIHAWGEAAEGSEKGWNEAHVDRQFRRLNAKFVAKGVGVVVGEYAVGRRFNLGKKLNAERDRSRLHWSRYVTQSMVRHGLVPMFWDNGFKGNTGTALFDRSTGRRVDPALIEVLVDPAYKRTD